MTSLNHILRKCVGGYKFTKSQEKINPLMYIDDIKLFVKNKKDLEIQIEVVKIYHLNIGMEFSIEKYPELIMKSEKQHNTEGIERLNQEKIRTLGKKETYKYLGILEVDIIKQAEKKEKTKKAYLRKTREILSKR